MHGIWSILKKKSLVKEIPLCLKYNIKMKLNMYTETEYVFNFIFNIKKKSLGCFIVQHEWPQHEAISTLLHAVDCTENEKEIWFVFHWYFALFYRLNLV